MPCRHFYTSMRTVHHVWAFKEQSALKTLIMLDISEHIIIQYILKVGIQSLN